MATKIYINGNYLVAIEATRNDQFFRLPLDKVRYNRDRSDVFYFQNNDGTLNGFDLNSLSLVGANSLEKTLPTSLESYVQTTFEFADIVDRAGAPYASANAFEDLLASNLGVLCCAGGGGGNETGIETFFIASNGSFGVGVSWADFGFIENVPVLLYNNNLTEKASFTFSSLKRFKLDLVNPIISFTVYSTVLPILNDSVQWLLECRYTAIGEKPTAIADELLSFTQTLTILDNNTRQLELEFTLDKTLIDDKDVLNFTLLRNGGSVNDTYGSDIASGHSLLTLETYNHNQ